MKKVIKLAIRIALFGFASTAFTQELVVDQTYYFKNNLGRKISQEKLFLNEKEIIPSGISIIKRDQIRIVNIEKDRVYFEYLLFKEKPDSDKYTLFNVTKVNDIEDKNIFSMSEADFKEYTRVFYSKFRGFKYGAYTIPIRLRSSNGIFEFDSNLSLGANIIAAYGSRFRKNRYIDFSFGIGVTKVNLNSQNSILGKKDTEFESIDVLSPAAFTISVGTLIGLGENVNIGGYLGWDSLSTADNKAKWIYNKKPWFGIGIGLSFENKTVNSNTSSDQATKL